MRLQVGECFEWIECCNPQEAGVWRVTRVTAGSATARKDRMVKKRVVASYEWVTDDKGRRRKQMLAEPEVKEFMAPSDDTARISPHAMVKRVPCSDIE